MGRIRKLPDHLVNKIAAGEVVERPAAAVKELVENALDAHATTISVDLGDGGAALIRVTDNGIGMSPLELPIALERHATSKLEDEDDLQAVMTLGFRGEALPAICAVSRFTITSRAKGESEGLRLGGEAGVVAQRLGVPTEVGTTVEIRDLFFNTPARLKFLKSSAAELSASLRALAHLVLAQPEVHVRVTHNGRAVMTTPAARDLRHRIGALWGHELASRLLAIGRTEHEITVSGLASPPDVTRGGRDDVIVTVNGRPVRDPTLFQAVLAAYRPLLPRDRFPLVCLSIAMPAADVDVNVHPTKAWVRFRHPRLVQEMIAAALAETLRQQSVVPEQHADVPGMSSSVPASPTSTGWPERSEDPAQAALFAEAPAPYAASLFGRVLGQVQDTFVVSTSEKEVFFVDQHVAHERVIYEQLEASLIGGEAASQTLLFPETLSLAPASRTLLERWREPLERLGFAFEGFGGQAIVLRAVPALLRGDEPKRLVEAAVDELSGPRGGEPSLERARAFVACRAAIKANVPLAREEMERLIADLGGTATPYFCPHGRPIVSRISLSDIRRELKRNW